MAAPAVLDRDEIHVWRARLDVDSATLTALESTLALEEREGADRFRFARDRRRYVAGRGLLRTLLARYLTIAPDAVPIGRRAGGKPELCGWPDLRFNVSHSADVALFAVGWRREVGIDVERIATELNWRPLAARFFSPPERAALAQAGADAAAVFTRLWVTKEAYLKGMGVGLAGRLDAPVTAESGWHVEELDVGPGYAAAVAAEGQGWRVVFADWRAEPVSVRC